LQLIESINNLDIIYIIIPYCLLLILGIKFRDYCARIYYRNFETLEH